MSSRALIMLLLTEHMVSTSFSAPSQSVVWHLYGPGDMKEWHARTMHLPPYY